MDSLVQPEASVVQTGLGLSYLGEPVYAFSGLLPVSADVTTVLEFTTGSGYIVGEFQVNAGYDDKSS